MESSTQVFRAMLDERGVEWWNETDPEPQTVTMARFGDQLIEYHENVNGTTGYHVWNMRDLTPEQAIEATLGGDLKAENEKLQDENERLHSCLSDSAENERIIDHEFRELQAENDKLRELVLNLRRVIPADVVGVVVGANTDHPTYYKFDVAMRELGIGEDG